MSIVRIVYKKICGNFSDKQILSAKAFLAKVALQALFHRCKNVTPSIECLPFPIPTKPGGSWFCPDENTKNNWKTTPHNGEMFSEIINNFRNTFSNFQSISSATYHVKRLLLVLRGKITKSTDPDISYLFQGTETVFDQKTYLQARPYFNHLDYNFCITRENCHSLTVDKRLNIEVPQTGKFIGTILGEVMRLRNHILPVSTHVLDCGHIIPILWQFEERKKHFKGMSGGRLDSGLMPTGEVTSAIPISLMDAQAIYELYVKCPERFGQLEDTRTKNRIFLPRAICLGNFVCHDDISPLSPEAVLRVNGLKWELPKIQPYHACDIPVGIDGDCYDRNLSPVEVKHQSHTKMPDNVINFDDIKNYSLKFCEMKTSMRDLTHQFKYVTLGPLSLVPSVQVFTPIEFLKGEYEVYLVNNGTLRAYRCKTQLTSRPHSALLVSLSPNLFPHVIPAIMDLLDKQQVFLAK